MKHWTASLAPKGSRGYRSASFREFELAAIEVRGMRERKRGKRERVACVSGAAEWVSGEPANEMRRKISRRCSARFAPWLESRFILITIVATRACPQRVIVITRSTLRNVIAAIPATFSPRSFVSFPRRFSPSLTQSDEGTIEIVRDTNSPGDFRDLRTISLCGGVRKERNEKEKSAKDNGIAGCAHGGCRCEKRTVGRRRREVKREKGKTIV